MTLGFSTVINGKANNFIPKIWGSFLKGVEINANEFTTYLKLLNIEEQALIDTVAPKLHPIRVGERWKVGDKIHFVVKNRTKFRRQFAPTAKVVSVQSFKISWHTDEKFVGKYAKIKIDTRTYYIDDASKSATWDMLKLQVIKLSKLAVNDGFESLDKFLEYFNTDFSGQIIHWTDLKY